MKTYKLKATPSDIQNIKQFGGKIRKQELADKLKVDIRTLDKFIDENNLIVPRYKSGVVEPKDLHGFGQLKRLVFCTAWR